MTKGIFVNRVEFEIDYPKFEKKYVVIQGQFHTYSMRKKAVEMLSKQHHTTVCAIKYDFTPGVFYALCENTSEVQEVLKDLNKLNLDAATDSEVPAKTVPLNSLPKETQLELLNIGLGCEKEEEKGHYSNIEGALFKFDRVNAKGDHVEALNIKYRKPKDLPMFPGVAVDFRATSFFDSSYKMYFKKKKREDYLEYVLTDHGNLKVLTGLRKKDQKSYIQHGYMNKKANIPFYDISKISKLDASKMGMLASSHRDLISLYGDIFKSFGFHRTEVFDYLSISKKKGHDDRFEKFFKEIVAQRKFYICNLCEDVDKSKMIEKGFVADVKEIFGIELVKVYEPVEDSLNIVIVEQDNHDENHRPYADRAVQHFSVASYAKDYVDKDGNLITETSAGRKAKVSMILLNAIIKDDVQHQKQTFFPWVKSELVHNPDERKWYFLDRARIKNPDPDKRMTATFHDTMAVMWMDKGGNTGYNLYNRDEIPEDWMLLAYAQFQTGDANIRGVISDGINIYKLCDTDIVMVPDVEKGRQKLYENSQIPDKNGNYKESTAGMRDSEGREEYLKACTDIRRGYTEEGDTLYFVGTRGDGMQTSINWAANLHCAMNVEAVEPLPDYLLELMLAPFVRFMGMTVVPYPFKYLHEYQKMNGMEDAYLDSDEDQEGAKERISQMTILDFL